MQGKACVDLGPRALWKLSGPDRVRFLNGQTTQDIASLRPGQAAHAAVTSAKGRMEGDIWVTHRGDSLWIDAPFELRETLGPRLDRYLIADDAALEDITGSHHLWHVPGTLLPDSVAAARFLMPGCDLWLAPDQTVPLPVAAPELAEALRILQGVPLWGRDIGPQHLPPEAAFERDAISYRKGCYIGQEVIARIKSIGHVNKRLVRLTTAAPGPLPPLPAPILHLDKAAGEMTSACLHPQHGTGHALAVLPRALAETPSEVEIHGTPWKTDPLAVYLPHRPA